MSDNKGILSCIVTGEDWQQEKHPAIEKLSQQILPNLGKHRSVNVKTMLYIGKMFQEAFDLPKLHRCSLVTPALKNAEKQQLVCRKSQTNDCLQNMIRCQSFR